jgi:hypothetical protein
VIFISIDRQIPLAVEDDIVVDDDFRFGHYSLGSVAVKRVRTTTFGDGLADALLSAWKHVARAASASTITTLATAATVASGLIAPNQRNHAERADT